MIKRMLTCLAGVAFLSGCASGTSEPSVRMSSAKAFAAPVPRLLTKWTEVRVEPNKPVTTKADRVYIADGSVGVTPRPTKWSNYFALARPWDASSADPKLNQAIYVLRNPEPTMEIQQGMGYCAGVWPRIVVRLARGWSSSTHIAGQVIAGAAADHSEDISRIFLLYPEYGQSVNIQLTRLDGTLTGDTIAIVAEEGSNPATDDWYVEIKLVGGVVTPTKPTKVSAAGVPQDVRDAVAKLKQSGDSAQIPHP